MMGIKKTAILGGSFDPIHLGHLFLLHCAASLSDYKRIIVIPAFLSNFKQNSKPVTPARDRQKMVSLAIEDFREIYPQDENTEVLLSDYEICKGGVSYTYDTVLAIKKLYGVEGRLGLIIGDDHISSLSKWYRFDELKNEVEFLICPREEYSDTWNRIPEGLIFKKLNSEITSPESSTAIRNDMSKKEDYLSPRVKDYVRQNSLYN